MLNVLLSQFTLVFLHKVWAVVATETMLILTRIGIFQILYRFLMEFAWMHWLAFFRILQVWMHYFWLTRCRKSLGKIVWFQERFIRFGIYQMRMIFGLKLHRFLIFLDSIDFTEMAWLTFFRIEYVISGLNKSVRENTFGSFKRRFAIWALCVINNWAILERIDSRLNFALFLIKIRTTGIIITHLITTSLKLY